MTINNLLVYYIFIFTSMYQNEAINQFLVSG